MHLPFSPLRSVSVRIVRPFEDQSNECGDVIKCQKLFEPQPLWFQRELLWESSPDGMICCHESIPSYISFTCSKVQVPIFAICPSFVWEGVWAVPTGCRQTGWTRMELSRINVLIYSYHNFVSTSSSLIAGYEPKNQRDTSFVLLSSRGGVRTNSFLFRSYMYFTMK